MSSVGYHRAEFREGTAARRESVLALGEHPCAIQQHAMCRVLRNPAPPLEHLSSDCYMQIGLPIYGRNTMVAMRLRSH